MKKTWNDTTLWNIEPIHYGKLYNDHNYNYDSF